jgi:thiosulfate reductase cytochrome b subunit
MKTEVYVYKGFERFWHWAQAGIIFFLAFTGFEVHGTYTFLGFEQAVVYHRLAAWSLLILIAFAAFWHLTTNEWRQYIPTTRMLRAQAEYYVVGLFRGAPHPTRKTVVSKLNPLQKLTYLLLKVLIVPLVVLSGLLYMFFRYPQQNGMEALNVEGLHTIAGLHVAGAFLLVVFVVGHVYLTTTGRTLTSNLRAMVTGFEELDDHAPEPARTGEKEATA